MRVRIKYFNLFFLNTSPLISYLGTWPKLLKEMEEFHDEIKEYQRDSFDRWSRTNLEDINR